MSAPVSAGMYAALPAEFCPPRAAAARIAALDSLDERERCFARVPEWWQPVIGHNARLQIALRIVRTEGKDARLAQLAATPEAWRAEVRAHVLRLWEWRRRFGAEAVSAIGEA